MKTVTIWDAVGEYIVNHPEMTLEKLTEDADLGHYVNQFSMEELQGLAGTPNGDSLADTLDRLYVQKDFWKSMATSEIDQVVLECLADGQIRAGAVHVAIKMMLSNTTAVEWSPRHKLLTSANTLPRHVVLQSLRRLECRGEATRTGKSSATVWCLPGGTKSWRKMSDAAIDDLVLEALDTEPTLTRAVHGYILGAVENEGFPMAKVRHSLMRLVVLGLVKRSGKTSTTAWSIVS